MVEKTSNKELNTSNIMSDALFPGRVIVQDLCYKSIKALDSYSLRVKNSLTVQHAAFSRRKFIGYNTILAYVHGLTGTKLAIFKSQENAALSSFRFID